MWVDDGGLIFYLVYEFERLRLYRVSTVPSQTTVRVQTEQNNARAGFAPDELSGSGTTQPRPCILSFNTFVTDKGRYDRSQVRSAWDRATTKGRPVGYGMIRRRRVRTSVQTVPYGTVLSVDAVPGTSCLAPGQSHFRGIPPYFFFGK
jgi:hypothetical protein